MTILSTKFDLTSVLALVAFAGYFGLAIFG